MKTLISRLVAGVLIFPAAALVKGAQAPATETPQQQAWSLLKAELDGKSEDARVHALRSLGLISGDSTASEIAVRALKDRHPECRAAAAKSLGEMGCTECIPQLKGALADKEARVVLAAAHALLNLKDPAAFGAYYEVLTGERKTEGGLVDQGMDTLKDRKKVAEIGLEQGIGFIPFAGFGYSAIRALTKDDVSPVRAGVATVLANDPDPRSGQALARAASDKSWIVREAALESICKRGDPKLLDESIKHMSDENVAVRSAAAATVIHLSALPDSSH